MLRIVRLETAAEKIADADLLLLRAGPSIVDRLIGQAGRSDYCHAALAAWWDNDLMCLETLGFRDARAVSLANRVLQWPGLWDVYESNFGGYAPCFSRPAAVAAMRAATGRRYGWWNLLRVALARAPGLRWILPPMTDDSNGHPLPATRYPPFCSQAVAMACRAGGVDPVPHLSDRATEPADLARSLFFRYRFTLTV